jgi:hypothetical protein
MNYLFILLGFDSFYESMIMLKMIEQLPPGCNILVFASELASTYLVGDERVFLMPVTTELLENKKLFDQTINEGELTSIFVFDYHKTLFTKDYNHNYVIIPFNPEWLDDLEIPVCLVDVYDMFNFNENNNLYLMSSNQFNVEDEPIDTERAEYDEVYTRALLGDNPHDLPKEDIEFEKNEYTKPEMIVKTGIYPYIIKLCPTCEAPKDKTDERFIYWNYSITDFENSETEKMKAPLGVQPDRKNILLNFSYQFILKSALTNLASHYMRVFTSLVIFLKKMDIKVNLYIIGMESNVSQLPILRGSKINVKAFRDPNYNIYKTIMSFADLVLTDTTWHPCLIDSACLKIPTAVIGNSMSILNDGTCQASYSSTDFDVFKELEKAIEEAPQTLFCYSSFPLKESEAPYFGFYEEKYLYYLIDIYSDESVIGFMYEFLVDDDEVYNKLVERCTEYKKRGEFGLKTEQLIYFFEGYETDS